MGNKTLYDNRELYDYKSRYSDCKPTQWQKKEAIYLGILLFLGLFLVVLNYLDALYYAFCLVSKNVDYSLCKKMCYSAIFGFLGGVTFDIKFFYRSVARGFWNEDRVFWRIFTPWLSIVLALVMAAVLNKTVIESNVSMSICIGFFSGYFSDDAIAKMHDVAQVIFSTKKTDKPQETMKDAESDGEQNGC